MLGEIGGARADAIYTLLLPAPCFGDQYIVSYLPEEWGRAKEDLSISVPRTNRLSCCVRVTNRTPLKEAS